MCNCQKVQSCQSYDCNVRCHAVVMTADEVSNFRNAFVTVQDENATYHVDEVGNPIAISRNPIHENGYTPTAGDYKNVTVYNFLAEEAYVFDNNGDYMIISLINPNGASS